MEVVYTGSLRKLENLDDVNFTLFVQEISDTDNMPGSCFDNQ